MPGKRITLPLLGEYYDDLLKIDSKINARANTVQANSLLCAKLQERAPKIKERVQYLADKRGISFEEMWKQLLTDEYEPIEPEEIVVSEGK